MTSPARVTSCVLSALSGCLSAGVLLAQTQPPPATSPDGGATAKVVTDTPANSTGDPLSPASLADWTIEVNPRLWWVSPSGDLQLPGTTAAKVGIEDLDLDTPEFTPAGSFAINADRFRFSFFGSSYSRDARFAAGSAFQLGTLSVSAGDDVHSMFDLGIYELTVGYRFYQHDFALSSLNPADCAHLVLGLYVVGGVRMYDLNIQVERPGVGSTGTDQFFIEPIAGIRAEHTITRDFTVNLQLDGGGFGDSDRTSYSFNISVDFQWRPIPWLGLQIGWRQTLYSFTDGENATEFQYDGAMAGLFAGLVLRF